jgi:hypothetical protein
MKKLFLAVGLAGMMAAPGAFASMDGTVTLTQGSYSYGNGGEFTATTSGLGTFQTFCIEYSEEFYPGQQYWYVENTGAVYGGLGGQDAIDNHFGPRSMDNISIGTAWLYSQFRADLVGSHYFGDTLTSSRCEAAGQLQMAIWWFEDEIPNAASINPYDIRNNMFYGLLTAKFGSDLTKAKVDSNGAYGVIAMNLYSDQDGSAPAQDQLAIVPEPTTVLVGMLLLVPFGASTLRILRRNRAV